ncbi:MAG: FtsX-like permease family protein [Bacteroidia bacterium]|jgi:ABC-type lipoprotein release transport system permease subunit
MNVSFKIARRYFFSRKGGGSFNLISIISGISLMGYIAGSAALIIVLSVFNGFEDIFTTLYNNFDADIQISATYGKSFNENQINFDELKRTPGIQTYSKVLEENVLLRYDERQSIATAKGVDEQFLHMTSLDSCMVTGEKMLEENGRSYALVGQGIAYQLAIDPSDVFQRLVFYVPKRGEYNPLETMESFNQDAIYPAGSFTVQQEVDERYVLTPLPFLRKLIDKPNALSSIEIELTRDADQKSIIRQLQKQYPGFTIKNRFEQREAFFKVMQSEKLMSYFILFFILLIAASNTIGSLYIMVIGKQKDIHILSSMGLRSNKIAGIFLFQGMFQALVGGIIGLFLGISLCYFQQQYGFVQLSQAASFMFQSYPVMMRLSDVLLVFATVLVLGVMTAIYPAIKARQLSR